MTCYQKQLIGFVKQLRKVILIASTLLDNSNCFEYWTPCQMLQEHSRWSKYVSLLTTGKAHPSDAMSIELPSDAARASRSGKPWLFHPTTGKAFPSDVASIELLSDTARAFPFEWMFSFNYQWCLPIRAVSIELPSNVARAFWICFSFNYRWCLPAHAVSIELPSNVTIAFRSSKPWPFSTSTGKAYPSDAVSIELPSAAARASRSGKPWLFRPSTGEAYPSDAVSIELPSDAARASRLHNLDVSVRLPARLTRLMLWILSSHRMFREPPGWVNLGISICLPAKLTRPMLWILSSRKMLREPPWCTTLTFPSVYRRGLAIWCSEYWTPVGCCESLPVAQPWLLCPSTGEGYPSNAVSIELPSDAARASQSGKPWLFHPSTGEAYPSDAVSIELPSDTAKLLRLACQI